MVGILDCFEPLLPWAQAKRLLAAILDAPDDARLAAAGSAAVAGGLSRARIDAAKTEQGKVRAPRQALRTAHPDFRCEGYYSFMRVLSSWCALRCACTSAIAGMCVRHLLGAAQA